MGCYSSSQKNAASIPTEIYAEKSVNDVNHIQKEERSGMIKLVKTDLLLQNVQNVEKCSNELLEEYWKSIGSIFSILDESAFAWHSFDDLANIEYDVLTYTWDSTWNELIVALKSDRVSLSPYFWIDIFCLDQNSPNKMATIERTSDIYGNAKGYHFMGFRCLSRGWCICELATVKVNPTFHSKFGKSMSALQEAYVTEQASKHGQLALNPPKYNDCHFTYESDRTLVAGLILGKFPSLEAFDQHVKLSLQNDPNWKTVTKEFFQEHTVDHSKLPAGFYGDGTPQRKEISLQRVVAEGMGSAEASGKFHLNESPANLFDGQKWTKFYSQKDSTHQLWQQGELTNTLHWLVFYPLTPLSCSEYTFTSGNDCSFRDPKEWTMEIKLENSENWELVDHQKNCTFSSRHQNKRFVLNNAFSDSIAVRFRILQCFDDSNKSCWQLSQISFK
mmetsp:Transcript_12593/g.16242  ORF Transcript_12593/g.16242 Transcript_12593/m.16242 type:complete len:446 (-) Transcript_12593:413-1750(-)